MPTTFFLFAMRTSEDVIHGIAETGSIAVVPPFLAEVKSGSEGT